MAEDKKETALESVRIDKDVRDNFREYCRLHGLRKGEVVETLILYFMSKEL